ncbi:hypothetical protein B0H13DRAFT_2488167 [Mycena leptocephala]|nr:hypothetical protein B0H13DRAFT_2488167 [Mycena leptocephala]
MFVGVSKALESALEALKAQNEVIDHLAIQLAIPAHLIAVVSILLRLVSSWMDRPPGPERHAYEDIFGRRPTPRTGPSPQPPQRPYAAYPNLHPQGYHRPREAPTKDCPKIKLFESENGQFPCPFAKFTTHVMTPVRFKLFEPQIHLGRPPAPPYHPHPHPHAYLPHPQQQHAPQYGNGGGLPLYLTQYQRPPAPVYHPHPHAHAYVPHPQQQQYAPQYGTYPGGPAPSSVWAPSLRPPYQPGVPALAPDRPTDAQGLTPAQAYQTQVAMSQQGQHLAIGGGEGLGLNFEFESSTAGVTGNGNSNEDREEDDEEESELPWARFSATPTPPSVPLLFVYWTGCLHPPPYCEPCHAPTPPTSPSRFIHFASSCASGSEVGWGIRRLCMQRARQRAMGAVRLEGGGRSHGMIRRAGVSVQRLISQSSRHRIFEDAGRGRLRFSARRGAQLGRSRARTARYGALLRLSLTCRAGQRAGVRSTSTLSSSSEDACPLVYSEGCLPSYFRVRKTWVCVYTLPMLCEARGELSFAGCMMCTMLPGATRARIYAGLARSRLYTMSACAMPSHHPHSMRATSPHAARTPSVPASCFVHPSTHAEVISSFSLILLRCPSSIVPDGEWQGVQWDHAHGRALHLAPDLVSSPAASQRWFSVVALNHIQLTSSWIATERGVGFGLLVRGAVLRTGCVSAFLPLGGTGRDETGWEGRRTSPPRVEWYILSPPNPPLHADGDVLRDSVPETWMYRQESGTEVRMGVDGTQAWVQSPAWVLGVWCKGHFVCHMCKGQRADE